MPHETARERVFKERASRAVVSVVCQREFKRAASASPSSKDAAANLEALVAHLEFKGANGRAPQSVHWQPRSSPVLQSALGRAFACASLWIEGSGCPREGRADREVFYRRLAIRADLPSPGAVWPREVIDPCLSLVLQTELPSSTTLEGKECFHKSGVCGLGAAAERRIALFVHPSAVLRRASAEALLSLQCAALSLKGVDCLVTSSEAWQARQAPGERLSLAAPEGAALASHSVLQRRAEALLKTTLPDLCFR